MSEQDNGQKSTLPRPTTNNRLDWQAYWKQQGQPWRTEPEIGPEQQKYLAERRAIVPDRGKDIYPFKGVKLNRADIGCHAESCVRVESKKAEKRGLVDSDV